MNRRPRVAIFDADAPTALAFVRSLGRAEVPLRVYSHRRFPAARFSRFCGDFARCPAPDSPAFPGWLSAELRSGRIDLVAPTSDAIAFACAELHESFAPELRDRLEPPEGVLASLFKDRFDAACARLGFATPWAAFPGSLEEARDLAPLFRYPAVLKPKSHVGVGIARGTVVRDAAELRREFRPYALPAAEARRYPELSLPLVQEYVPLALENLVSVSGVLHGDGSTVASAVSRKIAQWPPTLGIGIEFRPVHDPALEALGCALAGGVLRRGIFEVELIRDPRSGAWVAIDLNPRAHGFIRLDVERGNDLPLLWYRGVAGEAVRRQGPARADVIWTHGLPRAVWRAASFLRGEPLPPRPSGRAVDVVHDPRDPLPTLPFAATMLRHPGGLVRPFLRAPAPVASEELAPGPAAKVA